MIFGLNGGYNFKVFFFLVTLTFFLCSRKFIKRIDLGLILQYIFEMYILFRVFESRRLIMKLSWKYIHIYIEIGVNMYNLYNLTLSSKKGKY